MDNRSSGEKRVVVSVIFDFRCNVHGTFLTRLVVGSALPNRHDTRIITRTKAYVTKDKG